MATIQSLNVELDETFKTLSALLNKVEAAKNEATDLYQQSYDEAKTEANKYEHEDDAIDAGVFVKVTKVETLKSDLAFISRQLKTIVSYVKP